MRPHLATLFDDFRRYDRDLAVVRFQGVRRRTTTYQELARLAGRFAALLEQRGIGIGDRVVLWAENSAEWIAAFYGTMLRGALAVPLDAYGSVDFATRVIQDVQPKLVVGDAALLRELSRPGSTDERSDPESDREPKIRSNACCDAILGEGFPYPLLAFEEWRLPAQEAGPISGLSHDTPLQILFTSGTTGDPKGIVHTHGNVLASVDPIEQGAKPYLRYERIFHPLRFLHTLPLSHVFGQTMGLWVPAIFAAEVHFESRLVAPRLVETIQRERISVLAAVPRVMTLLKSHLEAAHPALSERVALARGVSPWMRWWKFRDVHWTLGLKFWALISGGGALPGPLEQFWNGLGFVVVQGYGMTETTALITLNHPFHVASGTIGKPLPGREVKLGPDGEVLVRGPMISDATWSGGQLRHAGDEWLATGDLAEKTETGDLRFLGRKSEVIVTAAGVNIHPEDLEAAIEQEPGVKGCAVVPLVTPNGPEPYAVLAVRGTEAQAKAAIEEANSRLADYQRVRRWVVWPEPDLPRTSTGKVRRKAVAAWVATNAPANGRMDSQKGVAPAHGDWLHTLISEIAGEHPPGGDDLRLSEDFHLDSLGRVQLAASLEERLGELPGSLEAVQTLGELRQLIGGAETRDRAHEVSEEQTREQQTGEQRTKIGALESATGDRGNGKISAPIKWPLAPPATAAAGIEPATVRYLYPSWPWSWPVMWARSTFLELLAQPLIWLLAKPRVTRYCALDLGEPVLVIGNHITAYDVPLIEYALPGAMRRRMAIAMSGEMLEDFRHFRNPERKGFMLFGPIAYFLVTAFYNVFPLPRVKDFQRSFAHAGDALDRGMNVMIFPEGARSAGGELARFRPGIGLLVKEAQTAVVPVAIRGLGTLKTTGRGWFRSGKIEVRVGAPLRFAATQTEAEITSILQTEVEKLLNG
jgi:long-chain acyl-CoA synthetase